jgi:hypothetical protein
MGKVTLREGKGGNHREGENLPGVILAGGYVLTHLIISGIFSM